MIFNLQTMALTAHQQSSLGSQISVLWLVIARHPSELEMAASLPLIYGKERIRKLPILMTVSDLLIWTIQMASKESVKMPQGKVAVPFHLQGQTNVQKCQ